MGIASSFVTEDGTVSGWQPSLGANAQMRVDNSANGAVYKGAAIARGARGNQLYAADFTTRRSTSRFGLLTCDVA